MATPQDTGKPHEPPLDTHNLLLIATRIHFALLRHLGVTVAVGDMLKRSAEAREVLWVCEASGDAELMALARQFTKASKQLRSSRPAPAAAGHTVQGTAWSRDTSGFGVSQPVVYRDPAPRARASSGWLAAMNWLRGGVSSAG